MTIAIEIKNLRKSFDKVEVFENLSLCVESGRIVALIGPNGSGKSTLLNILSGCISSDGGNYKIKDNTRYNLSYIFQNYRESLLPWQTNVKNLALPLITQRISKSQITDKVNVIQSLFGLKINWEGYPYELSGGQQQILAFMRALITQPKVLLIDEPFSALDYENNLRLRDILQKYYLTFKPTILLVTHNIEEAVHLADRIVIISKKPTHILEVIDNDLPYPRDLPSLSTNEFHRLRGAVLVAFQKVANL